jgi:carboxypeptidase Taq
MNKEFCELKERLGEIHDLNSSIAVLDWDQQVNMPAAGAEGRANQLSLLSRLSHEKFVDGRVGDLLGSLQVFIDELDPESDESCLINVTRREYDRKVKVPSSYVSLDFTAQAAEPQPMQATGRSPMKAIYFRC